jgi:hypothetical protein
MMKPSELRVDDKEACMGGLALVLFLGLYAFGQDIMGWSTAGGNVQIGLFLSFIFGIICGLKVRG